MSKSECFQQDNVIYFINYIYITVFISVEFIEIFAILCYNYVISCNILSLLTFFDGFLSVRG